MATAERRSRLRFGDLLGLGTHGLKAHPMRAALSALGIAIGIAAMVAVIGISTSSEALVREKLASLGTNMLTAAAGTDFLGEDSKLPADAVERVRRIDGVETASWIATLGKVNVYRNAAVDPGATGGLTVVVGEGSLLDATSSELIRGSWLNAATERYPAVVLGERAAQKLGIREVGTSVWIGGSQFTVVGILDRSPLAPELDSAAIIGPGIAKELFGFDGSPTTIYERSDDALVADVRDLLPGAINPESPNEVKVSRPSDALAAKNTVD
ncbi:MAG: ABC transporter permease, partial [Agromyces sp.]